jgi:hypothetical protein
MREGREGGREGGKGGWVSAVEQTMSMLLDLFSHLLFDNCTFVLAFSECDQQETSKRKGKVWKEGGIEGGRREGRTRTEYILLRVSRQPYMR